MSLTLSDYRIRISRILGMDNGTTGTETGGSRTDDQIAMDAYLNEGANRILFDTKCHIETVDMTLTANKGDYDLPNAGILVVERVVAISTTAGNRPMSQVEPEEIKWLRRTSTGVPPVYKYAVGGVNRFMVWPTPTAADTLEFDYVPASNVLSAGTDTFTYVPDWMSDLPELYALWKCAPIKDNAASGYGKSFHDQWQEGMARARNRVKRSRGRRREAAMAGRRDFRSRIPSTPSIDTGY